MISRNRTQRRTGFTLVELLTVIAIIGILVGLAIGAYFRVRVSQEEAATETTTSKIHSQLDQQWRSVLDNAKDQWRGNDTSTSNPQSIRWAKLMSGPGGGDANRGLAILTKFKLKEEFPQTMWEALMWPQQMQATQLPDGSGGFAIIPMEQKYRSAIMKDMPTGTLPKDPSTMTAEQQHLESAALLYIALARTRRGNAGFNPNEHLGPHAVGRVQLATFPGKDFDVFLDTWGQPIGFIRWGFGGRQTDLNQSPNLQVNKLGQPIDPQDPEKTLFNPLWFNAGYPGLGGLTYGQVFMQTLRHPLGPGGQLDPLGPVNLSPFVFSGGRDKFFGVKGVEGADNADSQKHMESANLGAEHDNIYSYRIKSGRGNN